MKEKEVIEFAKFVGKLKKVKRAGWVQKLGTENVESVADHSYATAVLAMILADLKGMDTEKIVRMALLHDIEESEIGDLTPRDKAKMSKEELKKRKEDAFKKISSLVPEELKLKYLALMKEHKNYQTKEARLLNEIENLEMVLQALEYEKEGYDKEKLDEFWRFIPEVLKPKDKDVIRIFKELMKERKTLESKK